MYSKLTRYRVDDYERPVAVKAMEPTVSVKACLWTTAIADDRLLSHLVSIYFSWELHFMSILDREQVYDDLVADNLRSTYTTPFLVNIIASLGCVSQTPCDCTPFASKYRLKLSIYSRV